MGKRLSIQRPDLPVVDLSKPVISSLQILTNWSKRQILQLHQKYVKNFQISFFIKRPLLKLLLRFTQAEAIQPLIIRYFSRRDQINVLQLISAIITFANLSSTQKAELAIHIFDFDGNKTITRDQMTILISSFIRGIASMTGNPVIKHQDLIQVSQEMFNTIDINPDGMITVDEQFLYRISQWVQTTPQIALLLTRHSQKPLIRIRKKKTRPQSKSQAGTRRSSIKNLQTTNPNNSFRLTPSPGRKLFLIGPHKRRFTQQSIIQVKQMYDKAVLENDKKSNQYSELIQDLTRLWGTQTISNSLYAKFGKQTNWDFRDLLQACCQGCSLLQLNSMLDWVNYSGPRFRQPMQFKSSDAVNRLDVSTLRRCKRIFDKIDLNGDGKLDIFQLRQGFNRGLGKTGIDTLFNQYDTNQNQTLQFDQFVRLITPAKIKIDQEDIKTFNHY